MGTLPDKSEPRNHTFGAHLTGWASVTRRGGRARSALTPLSMQRAREKPRIGRGSSCSRERPYCRLAITLSNTSLEGRMTDSGNEESGWSTRLSKSVKLGFSVST
jgi:hypothetical protein